MNSKENCWQKVNLWPKITQKAYKNYFKLNTSYVFFRKISYTGKVEALGMCITSAFFYCYGNLKKIRKKKIYILITHLEIQGSPPSFPTGNGWLRGPVAQYRIFHLSIKRVWFNLVVY